MHQPWSGHSIQYMYDDTLAQGSVKRREARALRFGAIGRAVAIELAVAPGNSVFSGLSSVYLIWTSEAILTPIRCGCRPVVSFA